ncbi:MAG: sugar ABC transporter ATP-binding protein [bacterium]
MINKLIEIKNITKTFGGVTALKNVSFIINKGECHALMGENGAGKSTLGKIIAGIHKPDSGTVLLNNLPVVFNSPRDAYKKGISMVHQELAFCPDLTVAENLMLGKYPQKWGIKIDKQKMFQNAASMLNKIDADIDPMQIMRNLSTAQNQMVQIANAVSTGSEIIIFDEPTSSLSEKEVISLFKLINKLKEKKTTIIYVSHRMNEIFEICDKVTVLRDGEYINTAHTSNVTKEKLIEMMIGRKIDEYFPGHINNKNGQTILTVNNLNSPNKFQNISFELKAGEILGFAGLVGSGRSEIALSLFGLDKNITGKIFVNEKELKPGNIKESLAAGIGLVPEDRKIQGLALGLSCKQNFSMPSLNDFSRYGVLNKGIEEKETEHYFKMLNIKTNSFNENVENLSGGNQQKVVLAKWLERKSNILIVDEPTRGIDIGSKTAIHNLIDQLAQKGVGIILISSELPEVINLSTRILVMFNGKIVKEFLRNEADQETILRYMTGENND